MNLQDIFYLTSIIFMVLSIIILLSIGIVLFYIKQKISDLHAAAQNVLTVTDRYLNNPSDIALEMGTAVAASAIKKVRNIIKKD